MRRSLEFRTSPGQSDAATVRLQHVPSLLAVLAVTGGEARAQSSTDSLRRNFLAPKDTTVARRDTAVRKDSVATVKSPTVDELVVEVRVPAGRATKDSLALARAVRVGMRHKGWPVDAPAPAEGAILPAKRIIAFYGNTLSKRMGILGQIPPDQMIARLEEVAAEWAAADPDTPVQMALHFIAVVAQAGPGKDGKYRLRMDSSLIEQVYGWAQQKNALLFLDIQPGRSSVMEELPRLAKFLERPTVHLGIDPEFNMRNLGDSAAPGKQIGNVTASEINFAIDWLATFTAEKGLPPKVLVVHRFTRPMVRGAQDVKLDPRVQVVINMDGWGVPFLKFSSYTEYVVKEPVQFTGFKLFYRHDTQAGEKLLTPMELVQLRPKPLYIQYQ